MAVDRIVVGIDDSAESAAALEFAVEEAKLRDATLEVVSVYAPAAGSAAFPALPASGDRDLEKRRHLATQKVLEDAVAGLGEAASGLKLETHAVKHARPSTVLIERSGDADLVVVSARGRGGFRGLRLGSVSEQVVRHGRCPVVVVRPSTS